MTIDCSSCLGVIPQHHVTIVGCQRAGDATRA
jgi:hypothetical protein